MINKKRLGLIFLTIINCSALCLIYWYTLIACSTKVDNILHASYEPSGMQLVVYFISFPLFLMLALLSFLHSYYFCLKKSLGMRLSIIWFSYFFLALCVDLMHLPSGNNLFYYGGLVISFIAIGYIFSLTYCQIIQLIIYCKGD